MGVSTGVSSNQDDVRGHYHDLVREEVLDHVPASGGTLLDVGGGLGGTANALREAGKADRIGVIDLVSPTVELFPLDFRYALNLEDPAALDAVIEREGPFDTILCLDVLEHLVDPWGVVARLHKALKPGGYIVASLPNVRNYKALLPLLLKGNWDLEDEGILDRTHLRFFVKKTAVDLLTSSGLHLELVTSTVVGGRKVRLARKLGCGLLDGVTDYQYIMRVKRNAAA